MIFFLPQNYFAFLKLEQLQPVHRLRVPAGVRGEREVHPGEPVHLRPEEEEGDLGHALPQDGRPVGGVEQRGAPRGGPAAQFQAEAIVGLFQVKAILLGGNEKN